MKYDEVFTFTNLRKASTKCKRGVRWKPSTQRYIFHESVNVASLYNKLANRKYKFKGFYEFDLYERGKLRHIKSLHISDRVVQKCFCDNCLIPILTKRLIYDNGACLKNKGVSFARNRFKCHLEKFLRHNNEGYILLFDLKSYFASIPHNLLKEKVCRLLEDDELKRFYCQLVDDCGEIGLGLGSQISQISGTFYLNELDQFIKHVLKIKYYGRYMDDGYLLHPDKNYLHYCLKEIQRICDNLQIKLNINKTKIVKLTRPIPYLKRKYIVTGTKKIIITASREGVTRTRKRLKKMFKHNFKLFDIKSSLVSYYSTILTTKSYHIINALNKLFIRLKGEYYETHN